MEFLDRVLKCSDCHNDFIFTAGEQLFFFDRQFKNDPKRCKLCKARRAGLGKAVDGPSTPALPLSRTETRTQCSACGVDTTVPFRPTQGRPVFCRSCFQVKRVPAGVVQAAALGLPELSADHAVDDPTLAIRSHSRARVAELLAETPAAALAADPASRRLAEAVGI